MLTTEPRPQESDTFCTYNVNCRPCLEMVKQAIFHLHINCIIRFYANNRVMIVIIPADMTHAIMPVTTQSKIQLPSIIGQNATRNMR